MWLLYLNIPLTLILTQKILTFKNFVFIFRGGGNFCEKLISRVILNISCLGLKLHAKTTFTFWIWKIWEWLKIVKKLNCLNNHLHLLTIMIAQNIVIQKFSSPKKGSMAEWSKAWNVSEGEKKVDRIKL